LASDNRYCGASTTDGRFWLGGNANGLACYLPRTGTWQDLSADVHAQRLRLGAIRAMIAAGDTVLWMASDGAGLIRYDIATGTYTHYDQHHGFHELRFIAIGMDARGRIWTSSAERVFHFDPMNEVAVALDLRSTLGGRTPKWTISLSQSGLLAMNEGRDIAVLDANAVGADRPPPAPAITQLVIDGAFAAPHADGSVHMRHDQAQLEVGFGALLPPGAIGGYAMRSPGEPWGRHTHGRVNLRGLGPGEHRFELRLMSREGAWGPATPLRIIIAPPWWQRTWARMLAGVLMATAVVAVFRMRLNWIRRRERKEEAMARTMNELKLQALRAQMDPHFIFNCLNSIDNYILMEQGAKASHYLNRFARLVRLILNQSESMTTPVEQEAELLRYYLELEAQRSKHPFAWAVNVDPELLLAEAELPTLLVQPYVENAIWHGIQHLQRAGRITVTFRKVGLELECVIEDDGIGRAASAALHAERPRTHESKAMRLNADRLRIFEETHSRGVRAEITDLKDDDGHALGTRVRLLLPIESLEDEPRPA